VPGWLYQVERGATSIWERWDALGEDGTIYDPDMNSYNHYAYGAVCQWLFEGVAGMTPEPGFDVVTLNPLILPALSPVQAWHDCRHGRIEAGWVLNGAEVTYTVTLPQGTRGRLGFKALTVDGQPPAGDLPPGRHIITFRI
jgi:alpha-L-rhamnosidase